MVWFCKGTDDIGKFLETAGQCGIDAKIMVLEDDVFLSKGGFSLYEYFISRQEQKEYEDRKSVV